MKTLKKIIKWIAFLAILGLLIGLLGSCKIIKYTTINI